MTPLTGYLIRSALSLVLLYAFFVIVLSRERVHRFNRYYLLFSVVFSLVVPLISVTWPGIEPNHPASININHLQQEYLRFEILFADSGNTGMGLLPVIYFMVLSGLLCRFLYNLVRMQVSKIKCPSVMMNGHRIVLVKNLLLPHTFFRTVYVNEGEFISGKIPDELMAHEFAHIEQYHSMDIILIELIRTVFWFNPVFILYKKAIMLNHEYLADDAVLKSQPDIACYTEILINIVFRKNNKYLASSFSYSLTKKRLLMLSKKNFPLTATLKKLAAVPLFLFMGFLVINAQDPPPPPPPPPPPAPMEIVSWWQPLLEKYNVSYDPSKSYHTENLFETGEEFEIRDSVITMKNALIISKTEGNYIRVIRTKTAIHDLITNEFRCRDLRTEIFKEGNTSALEKTDYYKDFGFRLTREGLSAPPPPPPPPPPAER